ncbi:MerR family transcriptional regulator [Halobacillus sp. A1]|uniref:MerR family transcriptional regulator n=1 Tax=Halobacillus sp. A1 TaxID=2880262 RepID=UPI0020A650D3|nr:MerR family transcriptional regulator [Halobacillus sp. A1]MCP3033568.1 MerR family transcriptional regulator [Halobacillus sp. A1]
METNRIYKPSEVAEILNISSDLLRKYTDTFNIQTDWTQKNRKGHRRYTKENVEELIAIREKIEKQNWSWDQVSSWLNGEEEQYFKNYEERSKLENKIDKLMDQQAQMLEQQKLQEQFNLALLQKLEKSSNEKQELKQYIDEMTKKRDEKLIEQIAAAKEEETEKEVEEKQEPKRKKLFGLF